MLFLFQQRLRFWLNDPAHSGMFSVSNAGDVILRQPLDYEMEDFYSFLVYVTDGRSVSSMKIILIHLYISLHTGSIQ